MKGHPVFAALYDLIQAPAEKKFLGPHRALGELRRVLQPGGQLRFLEHVRAKTSGWQRFQDFMTPLWKRVGAGCHPNRETVAAIERAGFRIEELNHHAHGPYPVRPFVRGFAVRP